MYVRRYGSNMEAQCLPEEDLYQRIYLVSLNSPTHLLNIYEYHMNTGDMWAQSWERLDAFTRPYPNTDELNPTSAMINQVFDIYIVHLTINLKNTCIFACVIFIRLIFI